MRSLLFVPADSSEKLDKAFRSGADAVILDLEDSVAASNKGRARLNAYAFLKERVPEESRPILFVRINPLGSPYADGDLDIVMTGAPDGIMLPKATGGSDVTLLHARLSVREALHGLDDGRTRIIPIATETAASLFNLGTYRGASTRLAGLTWGAEDLSADIGAEAVSADGEWTEPIRVVRSLALFAATAAGVPAIDTVHTDFRDLEGLARDCANARRDGFTAKLAIHPDQIDPINAAFTPSAEAIAQAETVVAAFAEGAGVVALEGKMLDRPHLISAERMLAEIMDEVAQLSERPPEPAAYPAYHSDPPLADIDAPLPDAEVASPEEELPTADTFTPAAEDERPSADFDEPILYEEEPEAESTTTLPEPPTRS